MSPSVDISPLTEGAISSVTSLPPVVLAVTVDFDKSVFVMMALFALLIIVLKPLLLDPMLRVFALREEQTDGAKADARAMQEKAAEILRNYEKQVAKVRAEAVAERDALRKDTARLESKIMAEAREAAEQIAVSGRARIDQEVQALQKDLDSHVGVLARDIASRVLGRELSS